jgi:phage-related protein
MAGLRFQLDLFVPETPTGTVVAGVRIPTVLASKVPTILQAVRDLKAYAAKINAGAVNEEATVKATYHVCNHDTNGTCGTETEI